MSLRVKLPASHIWVLCDVGAPSECNFVKPASRFSNRPAERRQRICHPKSRNQQSPECAASLGLQTLAGTLQPFPAICRFSPSVCVFWKEKTNFCNDSACCSSGLWAEHRAEDASNWLPGGGDAWPRAPDTGKKGSCKYYQVGFPCIVTHTVIWQMYLSAACWKKKVPATVFMMPTIVAMVDDNWRTGGTIHRPLLWPKFMELQFRGATERKHSSPPFLWAA